MYLKKNFIPSTKCTRIHTQESYIHVYTNTHTTHTCITYLDTFPQYHSWSSRFPYSTGGWFLFNPKALFPSCIEVYVPDWGTLTVWLLGLGRGGVVVSYWSGRLGGGWTYIRQYQHNLLMTMAVYMIVVVETLRINDSKTRLVNVNCMLRLWKVYVLNTRTCTSGWFMYNYAFKCLLLHMYSACIHTRPVQCTFTICTCVLYIQNRPTDLYLPHCSVPGGNRWWSGVVHVVGIWLSAPPARSVLDTVWLYVHVLGAGVKTVPTSWDNKTKRGD